MGILRGTADTILVSVTAKITDVAVPGQVHNLKFNALFKRRDYDDAKKIIASVNDFDSDVSEAQVVRDDLIEWRGLDGDGGPVEFTPENLAVCLQHPEYRMALFKAWGDAQLRRVLTSAKN